MHHIAPAFFGTFNMIPTLAGGVKKVAQLNRGARLIDMILDQLPRHNTRTSRAINRGFFIG